MMFSINVFVDGFGTGPLIRGMVADIVLGSNTTGSTVAGSGFGICCEKFVENGVNLFL